MSEIETKYKTKDIRVAMTTLPCVIVIAFEREEIKPTPFFRIPFEEEFQSILKPSGEDHFAIPTEEFTEQNEG